LEPCFSAESPHVQVEAAYWSFLFIQCLWATSFLFLNCVMMGCFCNFLITWIVLLTRNSFSPYIQWMIRSIGSHYTSTISYLSVPSGSSWFITPSFVRFGSSLRLVLICAGVSIICVDFVFFFFSSLFLWCLWIEWLNRFRDSVWCVCVWCVCFGLFSFAWILILFVFWIGHDWVLLLYQVLLNWVCSIFQKKKKDFSVCFLN